MKAMAKKFDNNQGFTLIEMAIVLVIIGIIIGAVVKGQDLVDNAKSKQFASKLQAWQVSLNTYYDRKGRLPGDSSKDGVIASAGDDDPHADITSASFSSAPEENFTIGGASFYVAIGNDGVAASPKNYIVVSKIDAGVAYTPTDPADLAALKFFEAYDTAVDGTADAKTGTVQGFTTATLTSATAKLTALSGAPTANDWLANTNIKAMGIRLK